MCMCACVVRVYVCDCVCVKLGQFSEQVTIHKSMGPINRSKAWQNTLETFQFVKPKTLSVCGTPRPINSLSL